MALGRDIPRVRTGLHVEDLSILIGHFARLARPGDLELRGGLLLLVSVVGHLVFATYLVSEEITEYLHTYQVVLL